MKYITLLAIPALATSLSAAVVIDNFDTGSFSITQTGSIAGGNNIVDATIAQQTGLLTTDTIGGARETRAHNTTGTGDNNLNNSDTPGVLSWSQAVDTTGHFHLYYGSAEGAFADLNADLSGEDTVRLSILNSDLGGDIDVSFHLGNGTVWTGTTTVPVGVDNGGPASPFNADVLFNSFTLTSGVGTFDVTDVDGITVEVAADLSSRDWQIDSIVGINTGIPEPSSVLLTAVGALGLTMRRRRNG